MELVRGKNLAAFRGKGQVPLPKALAVMEQILRGLAWAHNAGFVHRDIKPDNIMITDDGVVKVLDFGLAKRHQRPLPEGEIEQGITTTSLTARGGVLGTPSYMSPEQARGGAVDERSDLFSCGVVLHEMLAGQRPFVGSTQADVISAVLRDEPSPVSTLNAEVPLELSQIVARCLEKLPEKRYQTAKELADDLGRCLRQLELENSLKQKEFSPTLHIPNTLVSREHESQQIIAAFERAAGGAVEVLLVGGPSGVGKTALVRSVYSELAKAGHGLFLSGKHDQLGTSVPYAALAQAFGEWIRNVVSGPTSVSDEWRVRLEGALGPLARVIADQVPEIKSLMGPLPDVPDVPTEMVYNRIKLSWIEFIRVVTDVSPPLVLFLDDMQWVDPTSLELLKTLLTDVGRKQMLIIAAYRDNEVEESHPLLKLIAAVEESGVKTPRFTVGPLDETSVQMWLALALSTEPECGKPLASALFRKTRGNPFYLGQLLLELNRQKRVRRNLEDGAWHWDQDAVEHVALTDNVVELMLRRVVELPLETQVLLGHAACAAQGFSPDELSVLTGQSQAHVEQALQPAFLEGLVIRSDRGQGEATVQGDFNARYVFLHDRVQQAFYERTAPAHRARTHLQIGRRLQEVFETQGGTYQKQLELARHLNLGAEALEHDAERKALARLNLGAAKAAKATGSYRLQANLVEQAQHLLGESAWQDEVALSVELSLERIEADFMLKELEQVHQRAQALLALPLPALPRLAAQELRVRACVASGQFGEGERLGTLALAEHGIVYPETNDECIALAYQWIGECDDWFDKHPEGFAAMPADRSVEHLLCDALEAEMGMCAGLGSRPGLSALANVRNVKQATDRATLTPVSPFFIAAFAHSRSAILGEHRGGVRWAREGEQAATQLTSPLLPECAFFHGTYVPYERPAERSREHYQTALQVARASGSFQGTSRGLIGGLHFVELWPGRPLGQVMETEQAQRDMMTRAGDSVGQHQFALVESYAAFLRTPGSERPADEDWLTVNSRSLLAAGHGFMAEAARILEAHLFLAFGEGARALERAEEAETFGPVLCGFPPVTDIPLWHGLAAAKCWSANLAEGDRAALLGKLERCLERVRAFSEGCAENFLHKRCLLEAEHARIQGKTDEAMVKYEQALTLARRERFLHIEAIAAKLCANFHLQAGRDLHGAQYLREARDAYARWGAHAVVEHLEAKYPELLSESGPAMGERDAGAEVRDLRARNQEAQQMNEELRRQIAVLLARSEGGG